MGYSTVEILPDCARGIIRKNKLRVTEASEERFFHRVPWREVSSAQRGDNGKIYIQFMRGGFVVFECVEHEPDGLTRLWHEGRRGSPCRFCGALVVDGSIQIQKGA